MWMFDLPKKTLKALVFLYSYAISPLTGAKCRFYPTCSAYAMDAIERHGAAKGAVMTVKRLCRCHPWHKGDMVDPVPASIDWRGIIGYKRASAHGNKECGCHNHEPKE